MWCHRTLHTNSKILYSVLYFSIIVLTLDWLAFQIYPKDTVCEVNSVWQWLKCDVHYYIFEVGNWMLTSKTDTRNSSVCFSDITHNCFKFTLSIKRVIFKCCSSLKSVRKEFDEQTSPGSRMLPKELFLFHQLSKISTKPYLLSTINVQ